MKKRTNQETRKIKCSKCGKWFSVAVAPNLIQVTCPQCGSSFSVFVRKRTEAERKAEKIEVKNFLIEKFGVKHE